MDHQDWATVTLRSTQAIAAAKKTVQNLGPKVSETAQAARKLENSDIGKLKILTGKSRSEMAQARVTKGMTQKQLDQRGQFPTNSCNSWEAGKVCPTGPQINILHRLLGIKLERE
jgi:ribosome-binding protein aMBF1 (putative translation factor)